MQTAHAEIFYRLILWNVMSMTFWQFVGVNSFKIGICICFELVSHTEFNSIDYNDWMLLKNNSSSIKKSINWPGWSEVSVPDNLCGMLTFKFIWSNENSFILEIIINIPFSKFNNFWN